MYHLKNGKQSPTGKVWRKLEAAEKEAGIGEEEPHIEPPPFSSDKEALPHAAAVMEEGDRTGGGSLLADLRAQLAEKDRQIDRLLGLLEAMAMDAPPTSSADRGDAVVAEAAEEPAAYRTNQKKA